MRRIVMMRKYWVAAALLCAAALVWFALPCRLFHPCSITIHSTFVELPELEKEKQFADALVVVLHNYGERCFLIGNRVYVTRELAGDSELRSKYTGEAVYNVTSTNPTNRLPVELIDRYGGKNFDQDSNTIDIHEIATNKKVGTNSQSSK